MYKLVGVWCPTLLSRFCTGEVHVCQTNEDSLGELAEEKELQAGLCNMVSGCVKESVVGTIPRLLGEKNFSVQEERSGGSTGEILELKGLRWIVPSTDFLHHRRALSAFPQCTSRMRNEEEKGGVLWKSTYRQSPSTV